MGLVRLFDRDPLRLRTARWFRRLGRLFTKINPWRIHIAGLENIDPKQTYVVVSNHQSLADIPILCHLRIDAKWMAKAELFRLPLVGPMLRMAGDVSVDRTDMRKAARSLMDCARILRQGCSVFFFPEGTRSLDGQLLPFNDGPFQLAIREQKPILPLVVEGSGNALPRHTWIFSEAQDVQLRVLEPVSSEGFTTKQTAELRELVRGRIMDELNRLRGGG
jgi:1-acyl-sn-glycerol-3-phosphate acyltransferase